MMSKEMKSDPVQKAWHKLHRSKSEGGQSVERPAVAYPTALLDAVASISMQADSSAVAREAARQIVHITQTDGCGISKWDPEAGTVTLWAEHQYNGEPTPAELFQPFPVGNFPLTRRVLEDKEPAQLHLDDPNADPAELELLKAIESKALLMVPLQVEERTIGLIEVYNDRVAEPFSEEVIILVQVVARHAGIALERSILLQEAKQHAVQLEAIREATLKMTRSLSLDDLLYTILVNTLQILDDVLDAHIFLYQEGKLNFGAALWADGRQSEPFASPREDGLTYTVARSGKPFLVPDVRSHPIYSGATFDDDWQGSIIGIPLKINKVVVGVMNIAYDKPRSFTQEELRLLYTFADQAAVAIENARLHRLVSMQAMTDALTNLPNRRSFDQRMMEEIRRTDRYKRPFTLLFMDLDNFKLINDTFGHPVGDQTLREMAGCWLSAIRDTDFLARIGGDEFALILPETSLEEARKIKEKLCVVLDGCQFEWRAKVTEDFELSLSVGIATYPNDADSPSELIDFADAALYLDKAKKESTR